MIRERESSSLLKSAGDGIMEQKQIHELLNQIFDDLDKNGDDSIQEVEALEVTDTWL
jgi:hypothetical protein